MIKRHFTHDHERLTVIDPGGKNNEIIAHYGVRRLDTALTPENFRGILTPLLTSGEGQGICVNLSVDVDSIEVMRLCRELGVLYIDSSIEPWPGVFTDANTDPAERTNYVLRERLLAEKRNNPGGTTAVSCSGANPGMVSWLTKQALLNLAKDLKLDFETPQTRLEWARLMQQAGVKGLHIAERDTQKTNITKKRKCFVNTWSINGMIEEGVQPAELGWGTHEKWMPSNARRHEDGCRSAIYMMQPGSNTRVYSWCPTPGPQYGFLVSHMEAIAMADYFTIGDAAAPEYRPTCNYAYRPCNHAVLSLHELYGAGNMQEYHHLLEPDEIVEGKDELGVLLYGHDKNAYWYGSQLSIHEARELVPTQNATGLQVSSGVLAGMVWALENPASAIVEPDEMDFARCLEVQSPYLGPVRGYYTDWTPFDSRLGFFPEDLDEADPWQFKNILAR